MPVWPTCFWISCAIAPRPIRLPAAITPMSFIDTPPSASAPSVASVARPSTSLSWCLPNWVILMPRIQTSSRAMGGFLSKEGSADRLEAEVDRLGAFGVRADRECREPDFHAELHVLGVGRHVDEVGAHARALAVDDGGHERHRDAGGRERDDRERAQLALTRDRHLLERGAGTVRARLAAVEEARAAPRPLV